MPESLKDCTVLGGEHYKKVGDFWRDEYSKNNQLATGVTFCEGRNGGAPGWARMGLCAGECAAVNAEPDNKAWMGHVRSNKQ